METIFLQKPTERLQLKEGQLICSEGDTVAGVYPIHSTEQVLVYGNSQITTQALKACLQEGIRVVYFNQYGKYLGRLEPDYPKNIKRRLCQYALYLDHSRRLSWSKNLLRAKLHGDLVEIRRLHEQGFDFPYKILHKSLRLGLKRIGDAGDLDELRGIEGFYAREYYGCFAYVLPEHIHWNGREYHPAPDTANAVLSLIYGCCANEIRNIFEHHSVDHQCGFLHEPGYHGGGLAYDLLEVVRATICDHFVITLLHRKKFRKVSAAVDPETGEKRLGAVWRKAICEEFCSYLDIRYRRQTMSGRECLRKLVLEYILSLENNLIDPDFQKILPHR